MDIYINKLKQLFITDEYIEIFKYIRKLIDQYKIKKIMGR